MIFAKVMFYSFSWQGRPANLHIFKVSTVFAFTPYLIQVKTFIILLKLLGTLKHTYFP